VEGDNCGFLKFSRLIFHDVGILLFRKHDTPASTCVSLIPTLITQWPMNITLFHRNTNLSALQSFFWCKNITL
jgi:hypothetical protein